MYESVKRNNKFDGLKFLQEWSLLLQIPAYEKDLPIFLTNKERIPFFTFFIKNTAKKYLIFVQKSLFANYCQSKFQKVSKLTLSLF